MGILILKSLRTLKQAPNLYSVPLKGLRTAAVVEVVVVVGDVEVVVDAVVAVAVDAAAADAKAVHQNHKHPATASIMKRSEDARIW